MIKKKITIITFLLGFILNSTLSQESNFGLQLGVGSYDMAQLKSINDEVLRSLQFDAKVTDNVSPFWYYKAYWIFPISKTVGLGFKLSFHSTASRISRADYSGEYRFDNKLYCLAPGLLLDIKLYSKSKFKIILYDETGMEFSKINLDEKIQIYTSINEETKDYKSNNVYTELGLKYAYDFKRLSIGLNTGFLLDIKNGIINNSTKLIDFGNGEGTRLSWTGFRIGVFVSYNLSSKKN